METPSSLMAYVESQDRLDREAREMFPYDFSSCSVEQGYVKQQVFACLTCMTAQPQRHLGGVCYSCSITCHGEHELVELFNRRSFKCDCGSPALGDAVCNITKSTRPRNSENQYNDNFRNIFCYCRQAYDPIKEDGTMFQCLLCEDWFHDRCIQLHENLPDEKTFEHYVCRKCAEEVPWLAHYQICLENMLTVDKDKSMSQATNDAPMKRSLSCTDEHEDEDRRKRVATTKEGAEGHGSAELASISEESPCHCTYSSRDKLLGTSIYLPDDFRDRFCNCKKCRARLELFPALLMDEPVYNPPPDSDAEESVYDAGTRAMESTLRSMPRVSAIEGLLAYNKLRSHITACLKPLAERGEIITKEHVKSFFEHER